MDLAKVLTQLHLELDHLNAAIKSLEELQERVAKRPDLKLEKTRPRRHSNIGLRERLTPATGRQRTENRH